MHEFFDAFPRDVFVFITLLVLLGAVGAVLVARFRLDRYIVETSFTDTMPALIWSEFGGKIVWSNNKFRTMSEKFSKPGLTIDSFHGDDIPLPNQKSVRMTLNAPDTEESLYFDVSVHSFNNSNYYFAQSAQESAIAERDRLRFMKTTSETFAHLPVGVAVFDSYHDLTMFNPALSELLGLAPSWLATKPSLRAFIDRLRDKGDIPEPKNFKSWRDEILTLEETGPEREYSEEWSLSNGNVYRVRGKSYQRGAVALFIEDISDQVSIETEYQLEIRRLYNAFDALDSAIAIFSVSGELSFANDAFEKMWASDISKSVLVPDVVSVSRIWQEACKPTPVWGDVRNFVIQLEERETWTADVTMLDGTQLIATFSPLMDGQTMCRFDIKITVPQTLTPFPALGRKPRNRAS